MKILIADDNSTNRAVLGALVTQMGHTPIVAEDGREAVAVFEAELPDMVLMDVMMPVEDGLSATARIKSLTIGRLTPIVIITALDGDDDLIKGMEAGADDYFTKPIKVQVVKAKIRTIAHTLEIQRQIEQKTLELERYYFAAENEMRVTSHIMQRMTESEKLKDAALDYWLEPTERCSGDLIAAARTPGGALHLLLADGTGHGLSAALDVMPLPNIFYTMTAIAHPIGSIAAEMNAKIKSLLPTDHFIAATLISVNPIERIVEIWNGGNPPAWLVNGDGTLLHSADSRHLPIGVLDPADFDASIETIRFEQGAQVILYSDGLVDAGNATGEPIGGEQLLNLCTTSSADDRMANIRHFVKNYLGETKSHDDISLAIVSMDRLKISDSIHEHTHTSSTGNTGSGWRMSLRLGARELQALDPIPFVIDLLKKMQVSDSHLSSLFLITSELFNNALDHGLLGLDSRIKNLPDGFELYLSERTQRLANLDLSAMLEMDFENLPGINSRHLKIHIKDSGPGFDYHRSMQRVESQELTHGRGIDLVKKIAQHMEYLASGNEVIVTYAF